MTEIEKLEFERGRGIIWVCDVVGSSKHLNDNETAGALEDFLSRLYWMSMQVVKAAGGRFIKWTGDGFLAWFETPLLRKVETKARMVLFAASQLSIFVAATRLGLTTNTKFTIRHSVTFEHDALITKIRHQSGHESLDIIGRAVVLAFRLNGIKSVFPHIITQGELVHKGSSHQVELFKFKPVVFKREDYLRYFKGEKWGTDSIYKATRSKWNKRDISIVRELVSNLSSPENILSSLLPAVGFDLLFITNLVNYMNSGPEWSKDFINGYFEFLLKEVFQSMPVKREGAEDGNKALEEFREFSRKLRESLGVK